MLPFNELLRRAWPLFLEAARQGRTLTYGELAGRVGPPLNRRHVHRQLLDGLSARCRSAGVPDLAALVVRKDSGMPGAGFFDGLPGDDPAAAWADAVRACWRHPWPARPDLCLASSGPEKPRTRSRKET